MVISAEKTDLVRQFTNGSDYGLDLGYAVQVDRRHGMPAALDAAYAFLNGSTVVFGMPDTYIDNVNAYQLLLETHRANRADVTLGCFPTDRPTDFGMVDIDETGRITNVIDKPKETDLRFMWGIACWNSSFRDYLRSFMQRASASAPTNRETTLSDVFLAALEEKMQIFGTAIPGHYYDLGSGPAYRAFLNNSTDGT
jgi:glucose-1-phosphate thymidylyltransferase